MCEGGSENYRGKRRVGGFGDVAEQIQSKKKVKKGQNQGGKTHRENSTKFKN